MHSKQPKEPKPKPDAIQLPRYTKEEMVRIMVEKDPELVAQRLRELLKNK